MRFKMLQEEIKIEKEAHKWSIRKCYQIIKTYKGQTRTDTDKTDKTRQNKKMRVMICLFFSKQKSKGYFDIKRFNTYNRPIE